MSFQKGNQGRHLTDSQAPGERHKKRWKYWKRKIWNTNRSENIEKRISNKRKDENERKEKVRVLCPLVLPWIEHYCSGQRCSHCRQRQTPRRRVSTYPQGEDLNIENVISLISMRRMVPLASSSRKSLRINFLKPQSFPWTNLKSKSWKYNYNCFCWFCHLYARWLSIALVSSRLALRMLNLNLARTSLLLQETSRR